MEQKTSPRTIYFEINERWSDDRLAHLGIRGRYLYWEDAFTPAHIPSILMRISDRILEVNPCKIRWVKDNTYESEREDPPEREDLLFWVLQRPFVPYTDEDYHRHAMEDGEKEWQQECRKDNEESIKKQEKEINTSMKQRKILQRIYEACLDHDKRRQLELQMEEFKKIFKRKAEGKSVSKPKYTVVR